MIKSSNKKRFILAAGAVALLAGYGLYNYLHVEAPSYMTTAPEMRSIVKQVYSTGTVEGKTQVDVGAQASGQINKLYVSTGDQVKKGDMLCEIDPRTQENALKSAQAELEITKATIVAKKAEIKKLQNEANRQRNLIKTQATSTQDLEAAVASLDIAKAELVQYEATLNKNQIALSDCETKLGYTSITSPMDGTVYATVVEEGQTVNATQTTPTILRLADMSAVKIRTEISEADVVNVKEGLDCTFTILGMPHKTFSGKLGRIEPAPSSYASSSSSTSASSSSSSSSSTSAIYYNADIIVDNPDGILRIDMTADVTINIAKADDVLTVPLTALRNDNGTEGSVYILKKGEVHEAEVKLGLRDDQYVQVEDGLDKDAQIVIGDDVTTAEAAAANSMKKGPRMF